MEESMLVSRLSLITLASALCAVSAPALAQNTDVTVPKPPGTPPSAYVTTPDGARYYPGIGFRYTLPPAERVYGYYAGPRVYGYARRRAPCRTDWWFGWDCRDRR
jgi:hypothetical protein